MKRTWVVVVGAGPGCELCNQTTEQEFFGPYTCTEAESIATALNRIFGEQSPGDGERETAYAMPLENLARTKAIARYRDRQPME